MVGAVRDRNIIAGRISQTDKGLIVLILVIRALNFSVSAHEL
jgi:hypothetical protein